MPKYDVTVVPADGNAFSIMGAVKNVMKRQGATSDEVNAYLKDAMSGDYDHLLAASMAMVHIGTTEDDEDEDDYCPECGEDWDYCEC